MEEEEDEEIPQLHLSDQMRTVGEKNNQWENVSFLNPSFLNPETDERMDGGKIRGLGECLKRQQETGISRKVGV